MFYKRLKLIRNNSEKTQKEIAEILGVSRSTYAGWENGIDSMPLIKVIGFCNFFNINMDYLCGITNCKSQIISDIVISKKDVGSKLKLVRKENGDTQGFISDVLKTDQSNYSKYERGKTLILTSFIIGFAKYYNVSIDWLCGRSNVKTIV